MKRAEPHTRASLLARLGARIVRHPRAFVFIPLLLCLALIPLALHATDQLTAAGWTPENAESRHVTRLMEQEFGRGTISHYILFSDPAGRMNATDRDFRLEVERVMRPFRNDPAFAAVYTWGTTNNEILNRTLISDDGTKSLAVLVLTDKSRVGDGSYDNVRARLASDSLDITVGGWPATTADFRDMAASDLLRAEQISIPLTLILLLVIFGGAIAAGLPIALALLSIVPTLAAIAVLSRILETNIFSTNVVTMLGLAVGIDYALIMVSRFREESASTPLNEAIPRLLDTAGRAVLIAGTTVAIGLTGLLLFAVPAAVSTGLAGACVVLVCVALSLTALPASFVLWGHRISRRPGWRPRAPLALVALGNRLYGLRERFPLAAVLVCGGLVVSLALPVRHLVGSSPTMTVLPADSNARVVYDTVATDFPNATLSPVSIVVQPRGGRMTSSSNLETLRTFTERVAGQPGVHSAESIWNYLPANMTPTGVSTGLRIEPELANAAAPMLTQNAALVSVVPDPGLDDLGRRELVEHLRATGRSLSGGDFTVLIGGDVALDVDLNNHVIDRAPTVVGFVLLLTWLALFVQFRSLALPTKAILLNLASLGASFGALVWIFQDGHLSNVLAFEPTGYTVILIPILMFCFLFGLSMDFEVIMLSRIREAWQETGDNTRAIDLGLRRSAGIVTASASVMLIVFIAFGTSELQIIKAIGVGLGLAVFIDATVIRLILLPATMQLMGRWNWWMPFGHAHRPRGAMMPATLTSREAPE
ncbi:MAG TPA: MMPL family transporter [Thermomicrobiales bacterium]|nr:MMPL family transporter [Thermomicrobiales bacterium]